MTGKKPKTYTSPSDFSSISIGDCKVEIEGKGIECDSNEKEVVISVHHGANMKITVNELKKNTTEKFYSLKPLDGGSSSLMDDLSFIHVNPKNDDSETKSLLQDVLKIYMQELPSMTYAANTGKESLFLERCISSGKYKTLILRSSSSEGSREVMAAVSYQIILADARYAEIPLAVVQSKYQKKGIGHVLFEELRKRLQNVGISTIYCWADMESEGFWLKQGFESIGEVDDKGKARRLPLKADIRKALCFPGGSTLMVRHVRPAIPVDHGDNNGLRFILNPHASGMLVASSDHRIKDSGAMHLKKGSSSKVTQQENDRFFSSLKRVRCSWETSLSSLKSKRVRGGHLVGNQNVKNQDLVTKSHDRSVDAAFCDYSLDIPSKMTRCVPNQNLVTIDAKDVRVCKTPQGSQHAVMFMNIADDTKKAALTKIVEELGGTVTCSGYACTHVITGKARRTLNFCTALCSGAFVVSPNWLKSCFREGKFLIESEFILEDEDYLLKYKSLLKDAVVRARNNPNSLLKGYQVCLAKHIQPSVDVLSAIIKSAGGSTIRALDNVKEPSKTLFLASEEDMSRALAAAKKGIWTFSSDWFMSCVMKQELDLEAPQFAESL